jgi:hypothetical protein
MAPIVAEPMEQLLKLELFRLNRLQHAHNNRACEGDIAALNDCLRVLDQRARLLGLYKSGEDGQPVPRPPTVPRHAR